jgi:hypothetical protein
MFDTKKAQELAVDLIDVQVGAVKSYVDAFSKFSGSEKNTYLDSMVKFMETGTENAKQIIQGNYAFSGNKK